MTVEFYDDGSLAVPNTTTWGEWTYNGTTMTINFYDSANPSYNARHCTTHFTDETTIDGSYFNYLIDDSGCVTGSKVS